MDGCGLIDTGQQVMGKVINKVHFAACATGFPAFRNVVGVVRRGLADKDDGNIYVPERLQ